MHDLLTANLGRDRHRLTWIEAFTAAVATSRKVLSLNAPVLGLPFEHLDSRVVARAAFLIAF